MVESVLEYTSKLKQSPHTYLSKQNTEKWYFDRCAIYTEGLNEMKEKNSIQFQPSHQFQVILSFNPIVGCILLFLEPKNAKSIYFRFICGQWKLFKMLVHPDSLNKPSRNPYKFNSHLGTSVLRMNAATCSEIICFYVVFIVLSLLVLCMR